MVRPGLVPPTTAVHHSFLAAMAEYAAHGETPGYVNPRTPFAELHELRAAWHTTEGFAAFVAWARSIGSPDTRLPAGFVPSLELWWVAGDTYVGRLSIRTPLTAALREEGGNIGYDVRPTARGRGHATAMLAAALPAARRLGIDPALVTVRATNMASIAVVERNGGRRFAREGATLKFWVPTGLSSTSGDRREGRSWPGPQ
jgi:predicted acetyltransferase